MTAVVNHSIFVSLPLLIFPTLVLLWAMATSAETFRFNSPADIQAKLPPATPKERNRAAVAGWVYMAVLLFSLALSTWLFIRNNADAGISFRSTYAVTLIMELTFALIDLLIIDWLILATLRPRWLIPPSTRDCAGWRDLGFHLNQLLQRKSLVANVMIPLVVAGIIYLVCRQ